MTRTSLSHPLEIAEVASPGGGFIGVTFCPGKQQVAAATGAWARDLELDLRAIKAWGAAVLVTLVTPTELKQLGVPGLGEAAGALGLTWLHLPVPDVSTPSAAWERQWAVDRAAVHRELDRGGRVVVHCKGGLGRAGLVACLILVERGMAPAKAFAALRAARKHSVETAAQEAYIATPRPPWSHGDDPSPEPAKRALAGGGDRSAARKAPSRGGDWFERLTGFAECGWQDTQDKLE